MPDWCLDRDKAGHYWLQAGDLVQRRAIIGGAGVIAADGKREGDMATPVGRWALRHLYYRQDLLGSVDTAIPASVITPHLFTEAQKTCQFEVCRIAKGTKVFVSNSGLDSQCISYVSF